MLRDALRAGVGVEEFWRLTPRELAAVFESDAERRKDTREHDLWLAWHIVALGRARQMPSLRRLLGQDEARPVTGAEAERLQRAHEAMVERMTRHGR